MKTGRRVSNRDAAWRIEKALPFTSHTGSFKGRTYSLGSGRLHGADLERWYEDVNDVEYVVMSYATPIGWQTKNGTRYIVAQTFSATTSRHQNRLRAAWPGVTVATTERAGSTWKGATK